MQRAQAWVKREWLAECGEGLIALSGAEAGAVGAGAAGRAIASARQRWRCSWRRIFPHRFYIELQRAGLPTTKRMCGRGAAGRAS